MAGVDLVDALARLGECPLGRVITTAEHDLRFLARELGLIDAVRGLWPERRRQIAESLLDGMNAQRTVRKRPARRRSAI